MTTTRFAPSPTGYLHVGNLRTALFNYLIARQSGGEFILRLDDTDPERSRPEYADAIKEDLTWLGLNWDRVEQQSNRRDRYNAAADKLRENGRFYECFETSVELDLKRKKQLNMSKPPVYDRAALDLTDEQRAELSADRAGHWRFLLNRERIEWTDQILGDISIDAASVSDPVLIRGDGQFLYTLASVVDDTDMGVTHVVRGSDHVTNTATQIQIMEALGFSAPTFAHHSLLTGPQGEGLSKRLGTLALRDLRAAGIEPMALLSHLARLGSSDEPELMGSVEELVASFDVTHFGAAPTKFDVGDLNPLTAKYLGTLAFGDVVDRIAELGVDPVTAQALWPVVSANLSVFADFNDWVEIATRGIAPVVEEEDRDFISAALASLPRTDVTDQSWSVWTGQLKADTGRKGRGLFMPLRKALTGRAHGPDMSQLLPLLKAIPTSL
ncbi:MAG: glutamyl-tRNA synthetase [Paracoccaceae bacterium]|jgi:glutamyl-tRNA synthetase